MSQNVFSKHISKVPQLIIYILNHINIKHISITEMSLFIVIKYICSTPTFLVIWMYVREKYNFIMKLKTSWNPSFLLYQKYYKFSEKEEFYQNSQSFWMWSMCCLTIGQPFKIKMRMKNWSVWCFFYQHVNRKTSRVTIFVHFSPCFYAMRLLKFIFGWKPVYFVGRLPTLSKCNEILLYSMFCSKMLLR